METPVDKPNLQRVRDWFLFATFTGLSYADLKRLSEKDITQSDDGTYWIHIRRQKTETPSAIRLLNVPLQIIEKYRHERKSDRIFNLYCRGYLIKLTRELGRTYGFDMTFHKARHNFGTHITLSLGVPIETVSRMMGHKSISTTQIYAKVTDRKVDEDMKRMKEQTKGWKSTRRRTVYGSRATRLPTCSESSFLPWGATSAPYSKAAYSVRRGFTAGSATVTAVLSSCIRSK